MEVAKARNGLKSAATVRNTITLHDPQVKDMHLTQIDVPDSVRVGESFVVEAVVENGALVRIFDADNCGHSANPCQGDICAGQTCTEVHFDFDGETRVDGPTCHCGTELGAAPQVYSATFNAPQSSGSFTVSAKVVLPGSGAETGVLTATITVTDEAPTEPPNDGEEPSDGGQNGQNGGGFLANLPAVLGIILIIMVLGMARSSFGG